MISVQRKASRWLAAMTTGLGLATGTVAWAQMKTGEQMLNFGDVFGVPIEQRTKPFTVTLVESSAPGNILLPGEQPRLRLRVANRQNRPIDAAGSVRVIAYGTRGVPGDIWRPQVYKIADIATIPVHVRCEPGAAAEVSIAPVIPDRLGGYALVVDLGAEGSCFATSQVRTFPPENRALQYPRMSLDPLPVDVLSRLGVQAIRYEVDYVPSTKPGYAAWRETLRRELAELRAKNITALLMFMNGAADQPLGRPRPHLDEQGVMLNTKTDHAWLPSLDADFQRTVSEICAESGWPKGPVTAVSLWNEPWEGISISGWGADMLRYREIYRAMAAGVDAARKTGVEVLIGCADSSSNTLDKLFPDGSDEFLPWLDVCTVHYQGLSAPVMNKQWLNRTGPRGRVRIWDTESWIANTDDRVATVIAGMRAAGYDRTMGVYGGNIAQRVTPTRPTGPGDPAEQVTTWSLAAAVGAVQHFIGERAFRGFLFPNGLPWVFVFEGTAGHPDDGTVVVAGDLGEAFGADKLPFRTVVSQREVDERRQRSDRQTRLPAGSPETAVSGASPATHRLLEGGQLLVKNDGTFALYDFYGNAVPAQADGLLRVPLDTRGFFLRADGSKGSFERLISALRTARIDGYEPLATVVRDPIRPLSEGGVVRLTLTNVLNRPVAGSLTVTIAGLKLGYPERLEFAANETKEIAVRAVDGAGRPDNAYPLVVSFDAGADGRTYHEETIHVDYVVRRTPKIDGVLDDWQGVLPQTVRAARAEGPSLTEAAWFPFEKFSASAKSGVATAFLAYDDENLFFAAKIADDSPDAGTYRFATRSDDGFFYPDVASELDAARTLKKKEETWDTPSRRGAALETTREGGSRSFTLWSSAATAFALDVDLPAERATRVSLYFVDPDDYEVGRRRTLIEIQDRSTGRVVARRVAEKYGHGVYEQFSIKGRVRIVLRAQSWLPSSLSGIFFDPSDRASAPMAEFVAEDDSTGGHWGAAYGKDGYHVIGTEPQLPAYARVTVPEIVHQTDYRWPEGVRHFSYRRRVVLPSGSSPAHDNVQLAFGVRAPGEGELIANAPGTMPGYVPGETTDYEYALNEVAPAYGGGTEIWRLKVPGMPRKHFYPRQPKSPFDGPVAGGKLVVRRDGNTRFVEAALPWSELPLVRQAIAAGKPVRFSFRINNNDGPGLELAANRSVAFKNNSGAFHDDWVEHWSNTVEFGFER